MTFMITMRNENQYNNQRYLDTFPCYIILRASRDVIA